MAVTLVAATLAALALGQSVEAYTGSWVAEFGGKTFVGLELSASNGSLEGRMAIGNIQFVLDAATRQELAANGIAVPKPVALKRVPR